MAIGPIGERFKCTVIQGVDGMHRAYDETGKACYYRIVAWERIPATGTPCVKT